MSSTTSRARWYQEDGLVAGEWVQFETAMSYLALDHVRDPYDPELAAPMTGYARVTAVGAGGVVASPLFVAYARQ